MIGWKFVNNEKPDSLEGAHHKRTLWTTFEILFPTGLVLPSAHFNDNVHFWLSERRHEGRLLFS